MAITEPIHVICIHWGDYYTTEDINKLHSMVTRNSSHPIAFHVFSNEALEGLHTEIDQQPEPGLNVPPEDNKYAYRKEAGLCANDLGGLTGKRVFFFDLDVLITGDLDEMFNYPEGDKFYIINDWNSRGDLVGQASCYSFVVGTLGYIKEGFEREPKAIVEKYYTASQEYLSDMVIQRYGHLNFWPDHWCRSFRFHLMPFSFLRHFVTPSRPKPGTKLVAFHGHPDIRDALQGRWSVPGIKKAAKGWKKLYKACKPTLWINDYWK